MMACACRLAEVETRVDQAALAARFAVGIARRHGPSDRARINSMTIEMIERLLEPEQDVLALARLAQQVVGAAADDVDAMIDERSGCSRGCRARAAGR